MMAGVSGLLERDRELAAVGELFGFARAGSGRVVLVLGPAGIGKTGLLAAVSGMARKGGFALCEGVGGELERDLGWGVVRQLFGGMAGAVDGADRELFGGAAELALPVLGFGHAAPGVDALSPALHGLYWLAANLAERAPVAVVVDDWQWADPASVRFLHYLASRLADLPVLLVLAVRSDDPAVHEREASLRAAVDATVLEPAPLSVEASERMLGVALGRRPELEFARACHDATGGNPFLLSELGAQLAADGVEPTAVSASQVLTVSPRSVSHWVLLRLSRLPGEARRLAGAVAVLGGSAQLTEAAALADLDVPGARTLADVLFGAGVLHPGSPLDFVHPLVRAAVYGELAPLELDAAHARAARLIADGRGDPDAVAAQLMQTRPAADPWVVDALAAAAGSARERGAPEAALAWLRRALAEPPSSEALAAVLFQLGIIEAELSDPAALDHLRAAHELAEGPVQRARVAFALMAPLVSTNRPAEATELAQDALAGVIGRDRELELQLEALIADFGLHDSSISDPGSRDASRFAAEVEGQTPGERTILTAFAAKDIFLGREPASRAVVLLRRALADGRFLDEVGDVQFWHAMYLLHAADELDLAEWSSKRWSKHASGARSSCCASRRPTERIAICSGVEWGRPRRRSTTPIPSAIMRGRRASRSKSTSASTR
jgi:AAA ATPase domain